MENRNNTRLSYSGVVEVKIGRLPFASLLHCSELKMYYTSIDLQIRKT